MSDLETVIVLPTYNEAENLPRIVEALFRLAMPGLGVLVVDDNSPDGTGRIAEALSQQHPGRLHVLHRPGKSGLGRAYIAGFEWALAAGARYIFEMDADFSHPPDRVPEMRRLAERYPVVVGSRYVSGGRLDPRWGRSRRLLSAWGNRYARALTRLSPRDVTAGFKCFRREVLESIDLTRVNSDGYAFQIEMAVACQRKGFATVEVPITFLDRTAGQSKMSLHIVLEATWRVWDILFRY